MIIQVRGTSGSGKSTVVRGVMTALGGWVPVCAAGRKRPLYYLRTGPAVAVLGHYESACGGCDTVGSARAVYELTAAVLRDGSVTHVLQEGLLLSEDAKWTAELARVIAPVRVVFLTTPVERCIAQIKARRAEAGNDKPLNEANTRNRVAVIERARGKLVAGGIECHRASADRTPRIILNWLQASR